MVHKITLTRLIVILMSSSLLALSFQGCGKVGEEDILVSLQNSLLKIARQSESAIVVIEVANPNESSNDRNSSQVESRVGSGFV